MKLSIIIPVYNGENYLRECIDSVLQADSYDIEIIIINDGSTDKTESICSEYQKRDKRVNVINNSNNGVSYSRNHGIKMATGKYIMFVDSDDVLQKDWYSCVKKEIDGDVDYIIFSDKLKKEKLKREDVLNYIIGLNNKKIFISGPFSKLFKREMLLNNNIYFNSNVINGEDMLFNVQALLDSKDFVIENTSFYKYRITSQSVTHNFKENLLDSDKFFQKNLYDILKGKIGKKDQQNICDYCYANSIIMFVSRISNLNSYKEAKKYFFKIRSIYDSKIRVHLLSGIKAKIILVLFKLKLFLPIYVIFNTYSKKVKKGLKNSFINI